MFRTYLFIFIGLIGMVLLKSVTIAYNVFMGCLMICMLPALIGLGKVKGIVK